MRVLLLDPAGALIDFGMRCISEGHQVKLWVRPIRGERPKAGTGLIDRVSDWEQHMRWADIIVMSDNAYEMRALEKYHDQGFPIFGTNLLGSRLELDRGYGMSVMEKAGLKVMPSKQFSKYNEAIEYVKASPKRYVSKPCADADKSLSYVSSSAADMIFMLEKWKKQGQPKFDFILQEFVPGIEVAVGGWMGPNGFTKHICENFEHKKLMPGNYGPNCYSADTEVLTDSGWKFWPDVKEGDKICTLLDGQIMFEAPSQFTVADLDTELIGWQSRNVDILVTDYHNMYVQDDHRRKPFWFESATETAKHNRVIRRAGGGVWQGSDIGFPEFVTKPTEFAALLGAYIADGNCRDRSIVFGNCPAHKQAEFIEIADTAGYKAVMYGRDLHINGKELTDYFRTFGKAVEKRVPEWVRNGSVETINAFLYGYGCGDGNRRENNLTYTTISKGLADDLQEMLLKVGKYGSIATRDRRGESHMVNGVECINRKVCYDVFVNEYRLKAELNPHESYRLPYKGKVYCCTVTSHIIYVRRNGKACWLGQTGEQGTVLKYAKESQLFNDTLAKFEDYLAYIGHTGYVDLAFIIDEKGDPRPLEWTTRPGWPLFNIQTSLHKGSVVQWMADLLEGKDTLKVRDKVATGIVIPIGDYPKTKTTGRDHTGFPIYGLSDNEHLHLCEVMKGRAPHMVEGEVKEIDCLVTAGDYVAVAVGLGNTVCESAEEAYDLVKTIDIPESINVRDDVGERCEKHIPELQKFGYMTDWSYD